MRNLLRDAQVWIACLEIRRPISGVMGLRLCRFIAWGIGCGVALPLWGLARVLSAAAGMSDAAGDAAAAPFWWLNKRVTRGVRSAHAILPVAEIRARLGLGPEGAR